MSWYRRNYVPGGTYFFTVVTYRRQPILLSDLARTCLRTAIEKIRLTYPFEIFAFVLLADHLHTVWILPPNDDRYSLRWRRIKEEFTREYLRKGGQDLEPSISRVRRGEQGVWHRRFWEHTVRDNDDLKAAADYIHWNPVKHKLVERASDWEWSSFQRFITLGEYPPEWGREDPNPGYDTPEWG